MRWEGRLWWDWVACTMMSKGCTGSAATLCDCITMETHALIPGYFDRGEMYSLPRITDEPCH